MTDSTQYGTPVQEIHSNEIFQFIDHAGEFAKEDKADKKSLVTFLEEKSKFTSRGFDYSVVAILGPQSSGKSTLLNILFHTQFDEMDALSGRQQTTQGVWMGVSDSDGHVILVMDVEGTDGRERGEADVFERRTSLFSLTVTSVLIINMWMNDIGRFHAANMGLLKTIFEMNLQLFKENQELNSSNNKTLLLFVIRDYIGTPVEKLKNTLLGDLDRLWKGITKPELFAQSQVTDFFDIDFAWLPHKVHVPEEFTKEALNLRERFINRNHSQFLLKRNYDKAIPADGFGDFAYNIWEVVKNNKDLKIPTQKEALALIRCEDIMNSAYNVFTRDLESLSAEVDQGKIIDNFGTTIHNMLLKALKSYDELASRYHAETAARKREILIERIVSSLHVLFERQVERLRVHAIEIFRAKASKNLDSDENPAVLAKNFGKLISGCERTALDYFAQAVQESLLPHEFCEWNYSAPLVELHGSIAEETDRLRKDLLQLLLTAVKDDLEISLRGPISRIFQRAPETKMWPSIRDVYESALDSSLRQLKPCLEALSPNYSINPSSPGRPMSTPRSSSSARIEPDEAVRKCLDTVRAHGFAVVKKCAKDASVQLGRLMQGRFEAKFNFDENQLPRRWKRSDNIAAIFKTAKMAAEALLDQFAFIRLAPEEDKIIYFAPDAINNDGKEPVVTTANSNIRDDDNRIILSQDECMAYLDQSRVTSNQAFKVACADQDAARAAGLHPLIVALFFVVGFNELIMVFQWIIGPLLIPFIALLAILGYLVYQGGPIGQLIQAGFTSTFGRTWEQVVGFVSLLLQGDDGKDKRRAIRDDHDKNE